MFRRFEAAPDDSTFRATANLGFPIGLQKDIDRWVAAVPVSLEPGDGIVLYTDGVTD